MALYVPVFRMAIGYVVSFGRRWSLLEHMLLIQLSRSQHSVAELAQLSSSPERLIIESLINLLRAGWVEVRATDLGTTFGATGIGKRRVEEEILPPELNRKTKWISLCSERITGAWMRSDDLQLVHQKDLPDTATVLLPKLNTFDSNDGTVRDLLYLETDEGFENFLPTFRNSASLFARFELEFDRVKWLPPYAPPRFENVVRSSMPEVSLPRSTSNGLVEPRSLNGIPLDDVTPDSIIVGGNAHLSLLRNALASSKSSCVIHSCFLDPKTVEMLLSDFEKSAQRKVNVDLLWGLRSDPEDQRSLRTVREIEQILNRLPAAARQKVRLSPMSSGSHAKVILYDDARIDDWRVAVGSCNFLSSLFDALEISQISRSYQLMMQVLSKLIAAQQPASGGWSPTARRLDRVWNELRRRAGERAEKGGHGLSLLTDDDHYSCVTMARDRAQRSIALGCDLYGVAAETSVLVPMRRASELGKDVKLFYRRPSRFFTQEGLEPGQGAHAADGYSLTKSSSLHGKFLTWDDSAVAISSFNWLSTVVIGTRARGAELGILTNGPNVREILSEKLFQESKQEIDIRVPPS